MWIKTILIHRWKRRKCHRWHDFVCLLEYWCGFLSRDYFGIAMFVFVSYFHMIFIYLFFWHYQLVFLSRSLFYLFTRIFLSLWLQFILFVQNIIAPVCVCVCIFSVFKLLISLFQLDILNIVLNFTHYVDFSLIFTRTLFTSQKFHEILDKNCKNWLNKKIFFRWYSFGCFNFTRIQKLVGFFY